MQQRKVHIYRIETRSEKLCESIKKKKVFHEIRKPYESAVEETVYWKTLIKCTLELLQKSNLISSV